MVKDFIRRHHPDYSITLVMFVLMLLGLIVIYAVSPALVERINATDPSSTLDHNHFMYRQIGYLAIGIMAFVITSMLPLEFWRKIHSPLLLIAVVSSLLLVILPTSLTVSVNGATRWLDLGFVSFQPSELLKFAIVIFLAVFLASRIGQQKVNSKEETIGPLPIILCLVGFLVVVTQKDMGTMAAILAIFLIMLFMAGVHRRILLTTLGAVTAAGVLLVVTFPHRMLRVLTFLNPDGDLSGAGYHINQALIAVGSGGLIGKGLGQSVQAFGYVPEAANDSIFAIMAEKFGFVGTTIVLLLFGFLFFRIIKVMQKAPNDYMRLVVAGVLAWFMAHTIINVGAMLSLLPLTGVTLPFLSFGGTSLLFTMAALGLVLNISRYTIHGPLGKEDLDANTHSRWRLRRSRNPSASYS